MATISQLFVELKLSADNFNNGLRAAQREAKEFEKVLKPSIKLAEDIGKPLALMGTAIAGAFLLAAKSAADYGDEISSAAEKTGLTVGELSKLKYAADQQQTSFEGVTTGLKFLSKALFAAGTGSKEQAVLFKALGVEVKTASGGIRPMNDVLLDVAERFKALPDGAEKSALAMKLFGKAGTELIPFLNSGSDGIRKLTDRAQEMGLVLTEAQAKMGREFNDALKNVTASVQGMALSVGSALLPTMLKLAESATSAIVWASKLATEFPNVTRAAVALTAVIAGAGGLLVGLAAIGTIAPKVATGLLLIQSAMAPASILLAVRSYGDLSAAVSLLGATGLVAKLGMVGLAAGIGIAIGSIINMAIEAAGLTGVLDRMLKGIADQIPVIGEWITHTKASQAAMSLANKETTEGTKRAAAALAAKGIIVTQGTMSEQKYIEALSAAARSHFAVATAAKGANDKLSDQDRALKDLMASLNKTTEGADKLTKSFFDELRPADTLNVELAKLSKAHATDTQLVSVYAEKIVQAVDVQKRHGIAVSGDTARLYEWAVAVSAATKDAETAEKAILKLKEAFNKRVEPIVIDPNLVPLLDQLKKFAELPLGKAGFDIKIPDFGAMDEGLQRVTESELAAKKEAAALSETIRQMSAAGYTSAQISARLGTEINKAGEDAKQFGFKLDKTTAALKAQSDATMKAAQHAKDFQLAWATAMANLTTRIAEGLAEIIVDGGNFAEKMVSIAKDTAKGMLSAFLTGLISPLTDEFSKLGQKAADLVGKKLFNTATDKVAGAGVDAATSAAGKAAAGAAGQAAGGAASAANAGLAAATSSLTSTINMISGIASAIGSIAGAIGTMRLEGTMNAVEHNTRYLQIDFTNTMNEILWPMHGMLTWIADNTHVTTMQLDAIYNVLAAQSPAAMPNLVGSQSTTNNAPVVNVTYGDISVAAPASGSTADWIESLKKALQYNTDDLTAFLIRALNNQTQGQVATG